MGGLDARSRRWVSAWVILCLVCVVATTSVPIEAQIGGGALTGNVVDQRGAALPGVTVTVVAVATNLTRTVVTGQSR